MQRPTATCGRPQASLSAAGGQPLHHSETLTSRCGWPSREWYVRPLPDECHASRSPQPDTDRMLLQWNVNTCTNINEVTLTWVNPDGCKSHLTSSHYHSSPPTFLTRQPTCPPLIPVKGTILGSDNMAFFVPHSYTRHQGLRPGPVHIRRRRCGSLPSPSVQLPAPTLHSGLGARNCVSNARRARGTPGVSWQDVTLDGKAMGMVGRVVSQCGRPLRCNQCSRRNEHALLTIRRLESMKPYHYH